jgi:hypothetical protein
MMGSGNDVAMDAVTSAVVETARHAAGGEWGGEPRLYALARRASLGPFEEDLSVRVTSASADALIPIEQDSFPDGDPVQALAGIRWPAEVAGCVLVTEVVIEDEDAAEGRAKRGRLTVGVVRAGEQDGSYTCVLQLEGDAELIVAPDLADDLVAALLGTL